MILLKKQVFAQLDGTVDGIRKALQSAIQLEHSTIPTYLYSLYSIKQGSNAEFAGILKSVVVEEMLHMAIGCNLLNAIGGRPDIDTPAMLPSYPGPLPGSVDGGLTVTLAPISIAQVRDIFMAIEEPESPLDFPHGFDAALDSHLTIGQFYKKISNELTADLFTGTKELQVSGSWWPEEELFTITDLNSARAAISIIREQGEGTDSSPSDKEGDFAHYYRFAEIVNGRKLIKNPNASHDAPANERYIYSGDALVLDASKVFPLITNPALNRYPSGSNAGMTNREFNATYTNLLGILHDVFNGHPERLDTAIGIMESLKHQALELAQIVLPSGFCAGPTFEYQPS